MWLLITAVDFYWLAQTIKSPLSLHGGSDPAAGLPRPHSLNHMQMAVIGGQKLTSTNIGLKFHLPPLRGGP